MEHFIQISGKNFEVTPGIDDLAPDLYNEDRVCTPEILKRHGLILEIRNKVGSVFMPAQLKGEGVCYVVIPYDREVRKVDIRSVAEMEEEGIASIEIDRGHSPAEGEKLMIKAHKFWVIKRK